MSVAPFPSLLVRAEELVPRGSFAEAQAAYLMPDAGTVAHLDALEVALDRHHGEHAILKSTSGQHHPAGEVARIAVKV